MKKTLKDSGVPIKTEKFDYFEYVRNNPNKGKRISMEEFHQMIEEARAEKLKKAS